VSISNPPETPDDAAFDAATLAFYSAEAPVYTASGPQGASRHLAAFLDRLKPESHILELGCGGGRDAEEMIGRGFTVEATDGTPEIARLAEERLHQPVRVMRFDQLNEDGNYDAVWAHASLLHVPRAKLPMVLKLVYRALRPGGLHYASFKTGATDGRDRFGRYFNYPEQPQLIDLYRQSAPWEILGTEAFVGGGYGRSEGPWLAITVQKPLS
jgi:SAM-dependent methyltransferase